MTSGPSAPKNFRLSTISPRSGDRGLCDLERPRGPALVNPRARPRHEGPVGGLRGAPDDARLILGGERSPWAESWLPVRGGPCGEPQRV